MTDSAFLIVTTTGISRMVKSRPAKGKPHTRPALKPGEFAVLLQVNVPDLAFVPRPIPQATLDVSVQRLVAPPVEVTQLTPPPDPFANDPDYQAGKKQEDE
jgi:hypothetical protein